jgi:hypothetical protein
MCLPVCSGYESNEQPSVWNERCNESNINMERQVRNTSRFAILMILKLDESPTADITHLKRNGYNNNDQRECATRPRLRFGFGSSQTTELAGRHVRTTAPTPIDTWRVL